MSSRSISEAIKLLARSGAPVIWWEMAPSLDCLSFISRHAETVLGYSCESWYRRGAWVERIHPKDRERALTEVAVASCGTGDGEFEFRMMAAEGREVWLCGVVLSCEA